MGKLNLQPRTLTHGTGTRIKSRMGAALTRSRASISSLASALVFSAAGIFAVWVWADPFPPYWEGGTGAAIHYSPVTWPSNDGDGELDFGDWTAYTMVGNDIEDQKVQDPSNGGTAPQNYVNISSGCTDLSYPSTFTYFDSTNQVLMFRWRVEQIAHSYATGPNAGSHAATDPWKSALWTVLIDTDGDGYREFAVHLDGSSGSPGSNVDRIVSIYSDTQSQSIDYVNDSNICLLEHNPTAFVDGPADGNTNRILNFQNSLTPTASWPNGNSETVWDYGTTRAVLVDHGSCVEYFVDYQIPLAMLDATASACNGPQVTEDTPISLLFATANSLNNPLQKDVVLFGDFVGDPNKPAPFGDPITPGGGTLPQPIVPDVTAAGCGPTSLTATVRDSTQLSGGAIVDTIDTVDFYYYADLNGNGLPDDGSAWTLATGASSPSLGTWTASWDSTMLAKGQYLIGVRAQDDQGNITWSHLTAAEAGAMGTPPNYANPSPDPGLVFASFVNVCGASPSASKSADASAVTAGDPVQFTITVNASPTTALSLTQIDDFLPTGWTFVSTDGGTLTPTSSPSPGATGTVSWTFSPAATIAAGDGGTLVFTATASTVVGTYNNVAHASTDQGTIETSPVEVAVGAPELNLTKSADVSSANPGDTVTYTLTYSNDSSVSVTNAVLTDALPLGLTFVSATGGGTHDGGTPGTITWNLGTLAAGDGPFTVSFTATVDSPYPAAAAVPLINTGTIDSDQTTPKNADASIFVNVPRPALAIQKQGNVTQVAPGNNVIYTVTYTNTGNATATGLTITDPVPTGFTFVSSPDCTESAGTITCNVADLAAGATASVQFTLQASASAADPTTNTATISGNGIGPVPDDYDVGITQGACSVPTTYYFRNATTNVGFAGAQKIANTTAPTSPTATVTPTVTVGPVGAGRTELIRFYQDPAPGSAFNFSQAVTSTLHVDKSGSPQAIFWLTLFDYDPVTGTETQLATASTNVTGNQTNGPTAFNLGTPTGVVPENHRLLWVVEATNGHASQTNDVAFRYDGTPSPSSSSICTSPLRLTLDKQVDVLSARPGDPLTYTLKYANTGQASVTNAVLTDTLPAGVSFVSSVPGSPTCTESGGIVTCNLGTLAGATSGTVTINVAVDQPLAGGLFELTNSATLDSDQTDPVNDSADTTIVRPLLTLSKSADDTLLIPGDTVTYLLEITNSGGTPSTNISVSDTLPLEAYFTYVAASCSIDTTEAPSTTTTNCTESGGVLTAAADTLGVGETLRIAFQMTVGGAAPAGLTQKDNSATVSDDDTPATASNVVTVTISTNPNIQLSKSSNPASGPLSPGQTVTYTLMVSNTGSATATDVLVSDPIPVSTHYVLGSLTLDATPQSDPDDADAGRFDAVGNRVVFDIGSLAAGASHTMTFRVEIDEPLPNGSTPIDNTASATSSNTAGKQASANLTASAAPQLTLSKSAPQTLAFPLTQLSADAVSSTSITVDDAGLIAIHDYVFLNGTGAQVTAINGNTVTLGTTVSGTTGDDVNPVIEFVLSYQNTGNADATNVTVSDPLPANTTFVAADNGGTHDAGSPGTVSWNLGTVTAGGAGSLKFWATPTVAGSFNNTGTIDSDETAPTNSNTTTTTIGALEPSKVTSTPNVTSPGAQASYTISIFNGTGASATEVSITDEMEKGFSFDSNVGFNITGGTGGSRTSTTDPTSGDNPATWCCWTLSAGATLTIEYLANLSDEVGDGTYQNNVSVSALSSSDLPFDFLATTQEDVAVNWVGPNHVVVSWVEASVESGDVEVTWQTDAEVRTAGFYLKRYQDETASYEAVHKQMLRGVVGAPQGGTYRVLDSEAPLGVPLSYLLVEMENDGQERTYGPYRLTPSSEPAIVQPFLADPESRSRRPSDQVGDAIPRTGRAAWVQGNLAASSQSREGLKGGRPSAKAVRGLKIAVERPGLYRVEGEEIAEAFGLDLRRAARLIRRHGLRLTVEGREVPYLVEGRGTNVDLLFYGEGIDSMYTPHRFYLLAAGRSKPMAAVRGNPQLVVKAGQTFRDTVRFEEEHVPLVLGEVDGESDFWFWDYVITGDSPSVLEIDLEGVAPTNRDALLTISLRGAAKTGAGAHRIGIMVNGQFIGEAVLQNFQGGAFHFALPPYLVQEGRNTVELEGISDPRVSYSIVYVDSLSVTYDREYWASDGSLLAPADGHRVVAVDGFPEADIWVLEVTEPSDPRLVKQAEIGRSATGHFQAAFASQPDGRYLAVNPSGALRPEAFKLDFGSNLRRRKNAAEYVIVTTSELAPVAERLAQHRESNGLQAMVIDVDDIMDEFNGGNFDPHAIRQFLAHARSKWRVPPRYVALVGEGNYDYKDVRGMGTNLLPPLMVGGSWGLYGGDNRLGDLTGDGVPEVALGRIPAETAEQLDAYIDKLIAYEQSQEPDWTEQVLLVADDPDETGNYPADSEVYASWLPGNVVAHRVYLSQLSPADAFFSLVNKLNEGVSLMTYLGHAGMTQLAHEGLLRSSDLPELTNSERLPVVVVIGCHLGNFWLPGYPSLAEDMVLHPDGGAAAVWAPAGLSYNPQRRILGEAFLQSIYQDGVQLLGDAVLRALAAAAAQHASGRREVLESQILLGDPALQIKVTRR